jgi:hypothetical protein
MLIKRLDNTCGWHNCTNSFCCSWSVKRAELRSERAAGQGEEFACPQFSPSRMIRQDAGRGALPRDRRRTSEHGEQGHSPGNAPSPRGPQATWTEGLLHTGYASVALSALALLDGFT